MAHVTVDQFVTWLFQPKTPKEHVHDKDWSFRGTIHVSLGATTNNYNPTGLADATVIVVNSSGATLTGIVPGPTGAIVKGRVLIIHNRGTVPLVLLSDSALSTAANRFKFDTQEKVLQQGNSVVLLYETDQARWVIAGGDIEPSRSFAFFMG